VEVIAEALQSGVYVSTPYGDFGSGGGVHWNRHSQCFNSPLSWEGKNVVHLRVLCSSTPTEPYDLGYLCWVTAVSP